MSKPRAVRQAMKLAADRLYDSVGLVLTERKTMSGAIVVIGNLVLRRKNADHALLSENMAHILTMTNIALIEDDPRTGATTLETRQIIVLAQSFNQQENMAHMPGMNNLAIPKAAPGIRSATPKICHLIDLAQPLLL